MLASFRPMRLNPSHVRIVLVGRASLRRVFGASLVSSLVTGAAVNLADASGRAVVTAVTISFLASIAFHLMGTDQAASAE